MILFSAAVMSLTNADTQADIPTTSQYEARHQVVIESIMHAYNDRPAKSVVDLADMIEEQGKLCFPSPYCITGRSEIKAFFERMKDSSTDMYMIPALTGSKPVFNEKEGWLNAEAVSYKLKGSDKDGCQIQASEFWTWQLNPTGLLSSLSVYFDEASRQSQITACEKVQTKNLRGRSSTDLSTVLAIAKSNASQPVQRAIRGTLENHFHAFESALALPTSNPSFLQQGWFAPWSGAQEKNLTTVPALVAPVGVFQTRGDVRDLIANEVQTNGLAYGSVRLVSPISVAGNVASALTVYTDSVRSTGCIRASHLQFMAIELDPALVASFSEDASTTEAPYPSDGGLLTMNVLYSYLDFATERHHCEESKSESK